LPFGCLINRIRLSFKIKYMSNWQEASLWWKYNRTFWQ
jgi:hypothetical protein